MKKLLLILSAIIPLNLFAFSPVVIDQSKIDFLSADPFAIVNIKDGKTHEWNAVDKNKSGYGVFITQIPNYSIYVVQCMGDNSENCINNTLENFRTQKKGWQFYNAATGQAMNGYTNNPIMSIISDGIHTSFFCVSAANYNDEQSLIETLPNFNGWLF